MVPTGDSYGGSLNRVSSPGGNIHVRITVQGENYALYVNDAVTPATTLTNATFSQGRTALYSYSTGQAFDNVVLIPEPGRMSLLAACVLVLVLLRRHPEVNR